MIIIKTSKIYSETPFTKEHNIINSGESCIYVETSNICSFHVSLAIHDEPHLKTYTISLTLEKNGADNVVYTLVVCDNPDKAKEVYNEINDKLMKGATYIDLSE